jgi:probable phosphoglycerate mutase
MTTAVVIRPGETDFDQESRIQGALDLPLNARGQTQLAEVIDRLRQTPVAVVYASPTEPALTTAREIGQALEVPVKELGDLTNLNHGLWQGLRIDELRRKFPRVFKQWKESPDSVCPPEGETCAEAVDRVRHALRRPMKRKSAFAVVACEPLATLIAGVLRGAEPHLPGPVCGCDEGRLVEVIDTNGALNGHTRPAVDGDGDGDGAPQVSVQPPATGDASP